MNSSDQKQAPVAVGSTGGSASGCTEAAKLWAQKRTLENAINALACDLPEGYTVILSVENGAAWVEVENPDGHTTAIDEPDGDLYDCLRSARCYAEISLPNIGDEPTAPRAIENK